MMIVAVIAAGVVLLVALLLSGKNKALRPAVPALAVLTLVLVGINLFQRTQSAAAYTPGPDSALGFVFGQRVAGLQEGAGSVLALHHTGMEQAQAVADAQLQGLRAALEGTELQVVGVAVDPGLDDDAMNASDGALATACRTGLGAHAEAVAVVSFVGFPDMVARTEAQAWPPFFVLETGSTEGLTPHRESGVIKALATYRLNRRPGEEAPRGATTQELFDFRYTMQDAP